MITNTAGRAESRRAAARVLSSLLVVAGLATFATAQEGFETASPGPKGPQDGAQLYPLQRGNRWNYQTNLGVPMVIEVTETGVEEGVKYSQLTTRFGENVSEEALGWDREGLKMYQEDEEGEMASLLRIKLPLKNGARWSAKVPGEDLVAESSMELNVSITAGGKQYQCVRVTSVLKTPMGTVTARNSYAPGVGLVHQDVQMPGGRLEASLTSFELKKMPKSSSEPVTDPALPEVVTEEVKSPAGGMTCTGCSAAVPRGAKFCPQCGMAAPPAKAEVLPASCTGCGAPFAEGAKFCGSCGQKRVAQSAPARGAGGTEADARAMLQRFLSPDADLAALSEALRPTSEDYRAVFQPEAAEKLERAVQPGWDSKQIVIRPGEGNTEVEVFSATTEDFQSETPATEPFAGGYKQIAQHLRPGIRLFTVRFKKPGESAGQRYDSLVHVNGKWRVFPSPWRHVN